MRKKRGTGAQRCCRKREGQRQRWGTKMAVIETEETNERKQRSLRVRVRVRARAVIEFLARVKKMARTRVVGRARAFRVRARAPEVVVIRTCTRTCD